MKNKIKLFDFGIFCEALDRVKKPGFIGVAVLACSNLILIMQCLVNRATDVLTEASMKNMMFTVIIPFIILPMMMMIAFSYLNGRKTSDFYHVIPVKRECIYFSTILAVIVWIAGLIIAGNIIPVAVIAITNGFHFEREIFWIIGIVCLASFFILSCFALGISLTGNRFTNFFVSVMIAVGPRIIISIIGLIAEKNVPFLVLNTGTTFFNNKYNILFNLMGAYSMPFYRTIVYTSVVSLVYLVLGAIAFSKRKSETAGNAYAFKGVQIVARIVFPFVALLGGLYFVLLLDKYENLEYTYGFYRIFLPVLAVVIYFVYELIATKKIKMALKSLIWFPALVGVVILIGISIVVGGKKIVAKEIDVDKVDYVVSVYEVEFAFYEDEFVKVYDEEAKEIIIKAYNNQIKYADDYYDNFHDFYEYDYTAEVGINQGGVTVYRKLYISWEEYSKFADIAAREAFSKEFKLELPEYSEEKENIKINDIEFSDDSIERIYNSTKDELASVTFDELYEIQHCEDRVISVSVEKYIPNEGTMYVSIPISELTPKTYNVVFEELQKLSYPENIGVSESCPEKLEAGEAMEITFDDIFFVDLVDKEAVSYGGAILFTYDVGQEELEATARIIKMLEDNNNPEDYECILYMTGDFDLYAPEDVNEFGNYCDGESIDLTCKYYVSKEVLEEFIAYIDCIREI